MAEQIVKSGNDNTGRNFLINHWMGEQLNEEFSWISFRKNNEYFSEITNFVISLSRRIIYIQNKKINHQISLHLLNFENVDQKN